MPLPTTRIDDLERIAIEQALRECNGCITAAAHQLGVGKSTVYRKLNEYRVQDAAAVKRPMRFGILLDSQNGSRALSHY